MYNFKKIIQIYVFYRTKKKKKNSYLKKVCICYLIIGRFKYLMLPDQKCFETNINFNFNAFTTFN